MKDYLNAEERANLIAVLAIKQTVEKFEKKSCLSTREKYCLNKMAEWGDKFKDEILARIGEVLSRKIMRTLQLNELTLTGRYGTGGKPPISEAATEDLEGAIGELQLFHCNGCDKCNYKDCAVYAISVACDVTEVNKGNGCPFKPETIELDDLEDDDDF